MSLCVSFPLGALPELNQTDFYVKIYEGLTVIVEENDVVGVQIYPAQWPRKVLINLKEREKKEALLISGINVAGQHIELKDENEEFTRVTVKDLAIDFSDDDLLEILSKYGRVIKVDREMIVVNGRETLWTTGTRIVSMCPLQYTIPQRLTALHRDKQVAMSIWYRRPAVERCRKCGGGHTDTLCTFEKQVCFICKGEHRRRECPEYDGSRVSQDAFCFMSRKSPLSNFNTDFPITIEGTSYSCNEMYIQQQKALLFGDTRKANMIMQSNDPKEMKDLGKKIKGYKDKEWKDAARGVIMTCREKIYAHKELQEYLLSTGNRSIGEATPDSFFGIGIHISDPAVLNPREWQGSNIMGQILTELRSELLFMKSAVEMDYATQVIAEITENTAEPMMQDDITNEGTTDEAQAPDSANDSEIGAKDTSGAHVVMLGDSNLKNVQIDTEQLNVTLKNICHPGATLSDIEDFLKDVTVKPDELTALIIHLGTGNWSSDETDEVDLANDVYRDFVEALNACSARFPDVHYILSGVLPRLPQNEDADCHQRKINFEVQRLNEMLKTMGRKESNVTYVDNDEAFFTSDHSLRTELFSANDRTGVHLSENGCMVLGDNLTQSLRNLLLPGYN